MQKYHDDKSTSPLNNQEYSESLDLLRTVGEIRMKEAKERGVVNFQRSECGVYALSGIGTVFKVEAEARYETERWNEVYKLYFPSKFL